MRCQSVSAGGPDAVRHFGLWLSPRVPGVAPDVTEAGRFALRSVIRLTLVYERHIIVFMDAARTPTVAYIRVSTDKQADHGVSLDAQRAKVEAYAALYGLQLVEIVVGAGESASSLDRPGLQRALGMLRAGKAQALLVVELSRLTRQLRDWQDLVEHFFSGRYTLFAVDQQVDTRTAMGRMVLNIVMSINQGQREQIGEKTSIAMRHKIASGEYIGGTTPYGYRLAADGVHLEPVAAEQAVITEARALRAAGLSLRKVATLLDGKGLRARNGRRFGAEQVARMVAA